jgi:NAD-dependent DNA ligase
MAATEEELAEVDGIGPIIAAHVAAAWTDQSALITALRTHVTVTRFEPAPPGDDDGAFAGQSFVFTGKLTGGDRKSAQARVKTHGGAAPSGVTKTLTFLVVGDEGSPLLGEGRKGSKMKKAEKYQEAGAALQIISETRFYEMVAEAEGAAD